MRSLETPDTFKTLVNGTVKKEDKEDKEKSVFPFTTDRWRTRIQSQA